MKLLVKLFEARNLKKSDRSWQAYAQLKLGNSKRKSSTSPSGAQDPYWYEDFTFNVDDTGALLNIVIWGQDRLSKVFLGRVRLSIGDILKAENQSLPSSWYALEKRHSKLGNPITGEVRLSCSVSFGESSASRHLSGHQFSDGSNRSSASGRSYLHSRLKHGSKTSGQGDEVSKRTVNSRFAQFIYTLVAWFTSILSWIFPEVFIVWLSSHVSWLVPLPIGNGNHADESLDVAREELFIEEEDVIFPDFFDDDGIFSPSSLQEMPPALEGTLLSEMYMMSAKAMNGLLFGPGSQFLQDMAAVQKMTNLLEGPWTRGENDLPRRIVTYLKAATKLVPSVKATEEQVYSRADDKGFIVDVLASTPDVPSGSTFKVHVQFCIFSAPSTNNGEKTCFLRISWAVQFLTTKSLMKGFIEKGARQGLQENYRQFAHVLGKYAKLQEGSSMTEHKSLNGELIKTVKEDAVASSASNSSYWLLVIGCIRLLFTLFFIVITFCHVYSVKPDDRSRFEIWGIDLPDSLFEFLLPVLVGAQIPSLFGGAKALLDARH